MSGNLWMIFFLATIIIFASIFGWIVVSEIRAIYTLGVRLENSLIASGWAGFSELDLLKMGQRININNLESREIYLNKDAAVDTVKKYIKQNLDLDDGFRPLPHSYIKSSEPIIIEEISVYNPADLPTITSDGIGIDRTTIHIIVVIPKEIKFVGKVNLRKSVPVDIESFLSQDQM